MTWRVVATIRCGVLLQMGGEVKVVVPEKTGCHAYIQGIRIEQPRTIPRWQTTRAGPGYNPAAEYDLELRFSVQDSRQAHQVGLQCLGEVVAALSFLASAPVEIVELRVITDSPGGAVRVVDSQGKVIGVRPTGSAGPEPAEDYTSMVFPDVHHEVQPTTVAMADTVFLGHGSRRGLSGR
jgi:hypothetical protein